MFSIKLALPDEGMFSRSLIIDFLAALAGNPDLLVEVSASGVMVSARDENTLTAAINRELMAAADMLSRKLHLNSEQQVVYGVRDLRPIHQNDKGALSAITGSSDLSKDGYGSVAVKSLNNPSLTPKDLQELSCIEVKTSSNQYQINLGKGDYALIQPFAVERYERGYEFLRGMGGRKIIIRLSRPWLLLMLAGFAYSYGGFIDNDVLLVHIDESVFAEACMNKGISEIYYSPGGLIENITKLGVPTDPKAAFLLLIACESILALRKMAIGDMTALIKRLPLVIDRIRATGRAYSLIERMSAELYPIMRNLFELTEDTINWIRRITTSALIAHHKRLDQKGIFDSLALKLYEALSGVADPIDVAYYAVRVVAEKEIDAANIKDSDKARQILLSYQKAARDIVNKLIKT